MNTNELIRRSGFLIVLFGSSVIWDPGIKKNSSV